MSRPADTRYSKSTITLFLCVASSYLSAVAGFGVFHLQVLSVDLNTSSRCSDPSCKANDTSCGNITVALTACLSHHQLPLPLTPKCTFGREVLIVDVNSSGHQWQHEALMSFPFNFSWPGGFTLSVSASWGCQSPASTDDVPFSSLIIADHILPSSQWTRFNHLTYLSAHSKLTSHSKTSTHTEVESKSRSTDNNDVNRDSLSSNSSSGSSNSIGIMYKMFYINSSRDINNDVDPLQTYAAESTKKTDSSANVHGTGRTQTTSSDAKILTEKLGIFGGNLNRRPDSTIEVATSASDINVDASNGLHQPGGPPVVRMHGRRIEVAVRVACTDNYYGHRCSKFCRPRDDLLGHYRCSQTGQQICLAGWQGVDCTEAVCSERCLPSRGTCTSPYTCSCRQGWYGEHCDRCRTYPGCKHGTCHLPGQCVCHKGWTGPLCDVEELFCLEHKPCQNGGTCLHDAFFNYTCSCPSGFTGSHCEVPLCHKNFCFYGGLCQIAEGTRFCLCPKQFAGPRCQLRLINSDSNMTDLSSSCSGASCTPDKQTTCQGYQCYNKGTCTETGDSQTAHCRCPFPFTGPQCLQVQDPCESNPCLNGATCKTTDPFTGSFVCNCHSGYSGKLCSDVMPALMKTVCDENVICENGGTCEKWPRSGQYFCKCLAKFTGEFCELEKGNGCSLYTCLNSGTCVMNLQNEPTCVCERSYTGLFCQDLTVSPCSRTVCQNGGTCLEHDGQFVCACKHKFEGILCEKRVRRRETTIIVVESPAVQNERLEVKVESTFKSSCVPNKGDILNLFSATFGIWIIFLAFS